MAASPIRWVPHGCLSVTRKINSPEALKPVILQRKHCLTPNMKEIDDTDPPKNESERPEWFERWIIETQMTLIRHLQGQVDKLKVEVADLHHRRRVSRQQATDQDPEWF